MDEQFINQAVRDLCTEIDQEYPRCGFHVGDGWFPIVADALRRIAGVGIRWRLEQVKQKFCQLRVYVDFLDDGIWRPEHPDHGRYLEVKRIIAEAEAACDRACEQCGAKVEPGMSSGWKGCGACRHEQA